MRSLLLALLALASAPLVLFFLLRARLLASRSPGKGDRAAPPVLFSYSQVLWEDVWQRPQEYAWRTAESRPVVYCAPVQVHNWVKTLRARWKPVMRWQNSERDLVVLSPLVFTGHFKSRRLFELNCGLIAWSVAPWLRPAAAVDCVVNTPFALPVVEHLFGLERNSRLKSLTYDVIDDFTVFDWSPSFGKELDHRLLSMADTCFTGTYELAEQRRPLRPEVEFIPCGVEYDLFSKPAGMPQDLQGISQPIIGYFGTLSDRLDLELLDRLAREIPEATLVMIGPVHLAESVLPRGAGNVRYLGLKRHEELPGYAQAFRVALIPFRLTEATLKLNPVKTLEYLAAGVPVVSTAIPDVERFFSSSVLVARNADEFIRHVRTCLDQPDSGRREAGVEMARRASWAAMTQRMNELIDGAHSRAEEGQTR